MKYFPWFIMDIEASMKVSRIYLNALDSRTIGASMSIVSSMNCRWDKGSMS
jgi:hypothetical protein